MPPQFLFDLSAIDLNRLAYDQEAVRQRNPQRGDMEQLNGIVYADPEQGRCIGLNIARADRTSTYAISAKDLKSIYAKLRGN